MVQPGLCRELWTVLRDAVCKHGVQRCAACRSGNETALRLLQSTPLLYIKASHLMLMMMMMTCLNACECELGKVNSVEHTVYSNCAKTTCSQSAACMRGEACR